jgi:uncharacterized protein YbdZ (MbtH family)
VNPNPDSEYSTAYKVVANDEEQYSIWPTDRRTPSGWHDVGAVGTREFCLAFVEGIRTDMLCCSRQCGIKETTWSLAELAIVAEMSNDSLTVDHQELLNRFSNPGQSVEVILRAGNTAHSLMASIGDGFMKMKFTDSRGEAELGVILDRDAVEVHAADFENQKGLVHLEGGLILNCQRVRCIANINLETMTGRGCLSPVKP